MFRLFLQLLKTKQKQKQTAKPAKQRQQFSLAFRELKTVKTSNEMPNWRRQINKIDRQYSPQIRAFLKGTTSPKLILMLEMGSIWSNLHHIAGGIYNFYKDLRNPPY